MSFDYHCDLSLLRRCGQEQLDLVFDKSKQKFKLREISSRENFFEFFNADVKNARYARLKKYIGLVNQIFGNPHAAFSARQIDTFYSKGLSKWDRNLFNRAQLDQRILGILSRNLGASFVAPLGSVSIHEACLMERARKKAELALKLGILPILNKGCHGSLIYLDLEGRPIGVFKKEQPLPTFRNKMWELIRTVMGLFKTQDTFTQSEKAHAEVAASLADRIFGIGGLVPLTRLVTINGRRGSLMLWQSGLKEAALFNTHHKPDTGELFLFQLMVLYDYLLGNLDRHLENWLVGTKSMNKLQRLAMIDNGNAFPQEHPTEGVRDYFGRQKMYQWKQHSWAKYSFDERIYARMRALSPEAIDSFIDMMRKILPEGGREFLTEKRIQKLQERASLLTSLGKNQNPGFSPARLGETYSSRAIMHLENVLEAIQCCINPPFPLSSS